MSGLHISIQSEPMNSAEHSSFLTRVRLALDDTCHEIHMERAYFGWIMRFVSFNGKCCPGELGEKEVVEFLNHLATSKRLPIETRIQAFNSLLFLYRNILKRPLENLPESR